MLRFDPPTRDDLPGYERVFLEPEMQRWLAPPPLPPNDSEAAAARLARDIAHWQKHGFGAWVLRDADTGEFIGRAGLQKRWFDGPEIELAWAVVPEHWGEGIATEAARAAIAHARELGIAEVVAFTLPDNVGSQRVMQKAGMEPAGMIEHAGLPHVLYRIAP